MKESDNMKNVLKDILNKNEFFEEVEDNVFVPKYLGLIVNGVVVYDVNWLVVNDEEIMFMNQEIKDHPIVSLVLENLNSLLIITETGIEEIL